MNIQKRPSSKYSDKTTKNEQVKKRQIHKRGKGIPKERQAQQERDRQKEP